MITLDNSKLLSICIATFNRDKYLQETLLEIFKQIEDCKYNIEIVVADGASFDRTKKILKDFEMRCDFLKVVWLSEKGGVDKDYDIAVRSSSGKYCWLLSDDDVIEVNSITAVCEKILESTSDLIIVNSSCWSYDYTNCLTNKMINIDQDTIIHEDSFHNKFFKTVGTYSGFIGCFVIKRDLWTQADTKQYYDSRFIHIGVLSEIDTNAKVLILSKPLIKIRLGNAEWANIAFNIWYTLWPIMIHRFPSLDSHLRSFITKKTLRGRLSLMTFHRAIGSFDFKGLNCFDKREAQFLFLALIVLIIPKFLWRMAYYLLANLRNDETLKFHLNQGSIKKNNTESGAL
jgi:glycosyltransferase involved in cell wall biosynthesis